MKRRVVITGAAGGMGRTCARLFGATHDLVLTDISKGPLLSFAEELRADGYTVAGAHPGDLAGEPLLSAVVGDLRGDQPFTLLHTAGLSPSQADWRSIMKVNLVATAKLLRAVEPLLRPGTVAIVIASMAGHLMPVVGELQAILDQPLADNLLDRLDPLIVGMASQAGPAGDRGVSYSLSKQALIRLCERRASAWGLRGARIVTISPGLIRTPMGQKELAETPGAAQMLQAAPISRLGTSMDIALAAQFLASEFASFITGADLRIDGGSTAAIRGFDAQQKRGDDPPS